MTCTCFRHKSKEDKSVFCLYFMFHITASMTLLRVKREVLAHWLAGWLACNDKDVVVVVEVRFLLLAWSTRERKVVVLKIVFQTAGEQPVTKRLNLILVTTQCGKFENILGFSLLALFLSSLSLSLLSVQAAVP